MRFSTRLVPGLLGLAFAAPMAVDATAQEFAGPQAAPIVLEEGPAPAQAAARASSGPAAGHSHKGLMGRRSCTECQRARAKARDGVDVPPPPSALPQGAAPVAGHQHGHAHVAPASAVPCPSCEADAAAMGGTIVPGSIVVSDAQPAGRAVVGGEAVAAEFPAGRASVGGAAPEPIGMARASQGNFTPVAGPGALAAAPRDPSVTPSGLIPAPTPLTGAGSSRPKIITHLLDLPDLTRIGRAARERRDRAGREAHASVSYETGVAPVTELPSSVVFGKGAR